MTIDLFHRDHSQLLEHNSPTALREALILAQGCLSKLGDLVGLAPIIGIHLKSIINAVESIVGSIEVVYYVPLLAQCILYLLGLGSPR